MGIAAAIVSVLVTVFLIIWMWPTAKHWLTNGPRGTTSQWVSFFMILALVLGFVVLLVLFAKGG